MSSESAYQSGKRHLLDRQMGKGGNHDADADDDNDNDNDDDDGDILVSSECAHQSGHRHLLARQMGKLPEGEKGRSALTRG